MVCDRFGKLPNEPVVVDLTRVQEEWIAYNIGREVSATKDAMAGAGGGKGAVFELKDAGDASGLTAMLGKKGVPSGG